MFIGILEDEPTLAEHVLEVIQSQGHTGAVYATARAFLSELSRQTFDLLVFDWKLPDQDGLKVLKQVRTTFQLENARDFLDVLARRASHRGGA